jgi:hypothetical protein
VPVGSASHLSVGGRGARHPWRPDPARGVCVPRSYPGPVADEQRDPEDDMPLAELDAHARAEAALRRIRDGSDPTREAFDLANTLNDEGVHRMKTALRRWFRRG